MSAKHTPGPWHVGGRDKCTVYDRFNQRLANSFEGVMATQRSDSECHANARLIAAAPEMLEVLQTTLGNIMSLGPAGALESVPMPYRVWADVVRAAISKATGGEA